MVIDPRTLKRPIPPRMIDEPTPCRFCGYNLQGLMNNGSCPECGRSIRSRIDAKFSDDAMIDAPVAYLRLLALGGYLALLGWIGLEVSLFALPAAPTTGWGGLLGLGAAAWFAGVLIVTRPRPPSETVGKSRRNEWVATRASARLTQAFWVLAAGFLMVWLPNRGTAGLEWLRVAAVICGAIASAGMTPAAVYMMNLSYWACDTAVAMRLRVLAVFLPIVPLTLVLLSEFAVPGVLWLLKGKAASLVALLLPIILVCASPALLLTWCVWGLAHNAAWAVANHHAVAAKEQRFLENSRAQAASGPLADVGVDPVAHPAIKLGDSLAPPPAEMRLTAGNRAKGMVKKKPGEPNPYELAGDEP